VVSEAPHLIEQEAFGAQRKPVEVEQISRDQERVYLFAHGQVDRATERLARGLAEALANRLRATRERRIQMDVGDVYEAHAAR
jgi:hypothetical protein